MAHGAIAKRRPSRARVDELLAEVGATGIAERFVDFDDEVTLLAVRSIAPVSGKLCTWFSEPIGHRHERGDLISGAEAVRAGLFSRALPAEELLDFTRCRCRGCLGQACGWP